MEGNCRFEANLDYIVRMILKQREKQGPFQMSFVTVQLGNKGERTLQST